VLLAQLRRSSSSAFAGLDKAASFFHAQPVAALSLAEATVLAWALLGGAGLSVESAVWLERSVARTHQSFVLVFPLHHLEVDCR